MAETSLWPSDYGVHPQHCADVLAGSYDVPYHPKTAPVILDIGANVGAFAKWASQRWPGAIIHCYEPHPGNFRLLERTIADLPGVTARNVAVFSHAKEANLSTGPNNCGEGSIVFDYGTESIRVKAMASRTVPKADILKIDTEGSEVPILNGLADRLHEFSAVMLEIHSKDDEEWVRSLMKAEGFIITKDRQWANDRWELCFVRQDVTRKPVVWVATPLRQFEHTGAMAIEDILGKLEPHYADPIRSIGNWNQCPWDVRLIILGGGGIYQARNKAVTDFMNETVVDHDRLLFQDYDLVFDPSGKDHVKILSHDLSIVGGLYTTRSEKGHWVMNMLPKVKISPNGVMPVMELGTGAKCFKRSVFKKVLADNPWVTCDSDVNHGQQFYSFFNMGPVKDDTLWPGRHRGLTEDYWFDWLCRQSGLVTCVDTTVKLKHREVIGGKEVLFPSVFPKEPWLQVPEMAHHATD